MTTRAPRIRLNLGPQRITGRTHTSAAAATRDMRKQWRKIEKNLNKVIKGIEDVLPFNLKEGMQPVFDRSQELVPVDTKALKDSGFIEITSFRSNPTVHVGYAKGNKPFWATFVHEDLTAHHEAPTQAKFLEQALNERLREIAPDVAKSLRNSLGT